MTYYRTEVLADSPLVYLPLDSSYTTNLGSRTGVTLTSSGGVSFGTGRVGSGGVDFAGTGSATRLNYNLNTNDFMNGNTWTVEAWFKVSSLTSGYAHLFNTTNTSNVLDAYFDFAGARKLNVTVRVASGTSRIIQTSHVQDTAWHHLAIVRDLGTVTVYIDGANVGSNTSFGTTNGTMTTTTPFRLGAYGDSAGNENLNGSMDEVAIYTTALSSTRVAAHAAADLTSAVNVGFTATAMTASATANLAIVQGKIRDDVSEDAHTNSSSTATNYGTSTTLTVSNSAKTFVKLAKPGLGVNDSITSANLYLKYSVGPSTDRTVDLYRVNADWQEDTITYGNQPATTYLATVTLPHGSGYVALDISTWVADTNPTYGLALAYTTSNGWQVYSSEAATATDRPYVEYTIVTATPVSVSATSMNASAATINPAWSAGRGASNSAVPMTASAAAVNSTVVAGTGINQASDPMTASADLVTPIVAGQRDAALSVESFEAQVEVPGGLFASPVTVSVAPMEAAEASQDPTVTTTHGVTVEAVELGASAALIQPSAINGNVIHLDESEDDYFVRVSALAPKAWWRMTNQSQTFADRVSGQSTGTPSGTGHGVLVGRFDGPEDRASVRFPLGSYIEQNEPTGSNTDENTFVGNASVVKTVLEFSIRTDKANQFIMAGDDQTVNSAGLASQNGATEVFLHDGKIGYRAWAYGSLNESNTNNISKEFTGFTNVADGEWHHVVIRSGIKAVNRDEYGVEVWVDGKMDVRRYFVQSWIGFPDYIGGRPSLFDAAVLPSLPLSDYYEGDLSEVVWYINTDLANDDITRNYYAFMGWKPIFASTLNASAAMVDAHARGNQKKALYLYWTPVDEVFGGLPGKANQPVSEALSFDPMPALAAYGASNALNPFTYGVRQGDFFGFKVFAYSVTNNPLGGSYRDPVTDDQSLINLETDIDLEDYDVIMFKDWPDEGYETDFYEAEFPGQKARLLRQLRDANDAGIGLFVTNPRLAVDLGVIDRVEFVPTLRESRFSSAQGTALGLYDYASALKFPWNIVATDGLTGNQHAAGIGDTQNLSDAFLDNKAYYYHDTHMNNRFRVRALITGLTDLPGWMIDEAVFHVDLDDFGWQGVAYKYLHRDDGLLIGDEYIFNGSEEIAAKWLDIIERRYNRFNGTWATPPGHVVAGTVVTTFGAKHWVYKSEVDNPYADYATTIVLEPGDVLAGRTVGGRIFVNFTEQPSEGLGVVKQIIPAGSTGWPNGYPVETTAQREWDYSWTRTTLSSTNAVQNQVITVTLPNGSTQQINSQVDSSLAMVRSNQFFPLEGHSRLEMDGRGILWLGSAPAPDPNGVNARATAMSAVVEMPSPTVVAQRDARIGTESMSATAVMPKVAEDETGDADAIALPMRASATFTNYGKTLSAGPMLIDAELVENFNMVHASGEQVALRLHNYEVELFLKEDA